MYAQKMGLRRSYDRYRQRLDDRCRAPKEITLITFSFLATLSSPLFNFFLKKTKMDLDYIWEQSSSWISLLGLLRPIEFIFTVDNSVIWQVSFY